MPAIMRVFVVGLALLATTSQTFAHPGHPSREFFAEGLLHPMTGADHLVAMLTAGMWAALIGGWALLIVPLAFVAAMLSGFCLALAGLHLPHVEPMILASLVVFGLATASGLSMTPYLAALVVGTFALFHGYAHGVEHGDAAAWPFATGFVLGTLVLLVTGIAVTQLGYAAIGPRRGRTAIRIIAIAGAVAGTAASLS
jgi:urease accessory protein